MSNRTSLLSLVNVGWVLLIGALLTASNAFSQNAAEQDEKVDFATTIKPIFEQHCVSCHGKKDPEAFRIDLKEEAMDYIVAESAEDSSIYQVLVSDDEEELMPPADDENPLSTTQIESVKRWIDQGADWPAGIKLAATATSDLKSTDPDQESADPKQPSADPVVDGLPTVDTGERPDAKDAAAVDPKTQRVYDAIGSLHPAAVHLPIGLLLASGLFALFSLRGNFVMSDCAYYCLWLGTLGAILACLTGWWFSPMEGKGTVAVLDDLLDQTQPVFWHRTGALVATAFAFVLALFAASARNRDPDDGVMWKLGTMVLALGIGWVGHDGGELTHGKRHYEAINQIAAELFPGVFGDAPAEDEPVDGADADADKPAAAGAEDESTDDIEDGSTDVLDEVGQTSDET